ncbi:unnamed protein product [Notodromas monacha]|uniref:Solute carrier family 25 member 42 n=1 Tax=Notodromas monacha TaxID=399045 RepID=A0A7R9GG26_9CRUS|nr:unnamed protein product [Notodromas monacha]CAG0919943.1 unnamed protein product [Notodromas monacha]
MVVILNAREANHSEETYSKTDNISAAALTPPLLLAGKANDLDDHHPSDRPTDSKPISRRHQILTSLAAGAAAGGLAKTAIAPLDRTKINFQVSPVKNFSAAKALEFILRTYRNEGFLALWRGNSATLLRIVPYAAVQFASHEQWKHLLHVDTPSHKEGEWRRFAAGSLAGVTGQTVVYPLDVTKARMAVTSAEKHGTLLAVLRSTVKENGFRSLYRGYLPAMLGVIPYAGVSFYTFETLKQWHTRREQTKPSAMEKLMFGAIAGLMGQSASYPLDIVRRRMQTADIMKIEYRSVLGTLLKVYRQVQNRICRMLLFCRKKEEGLKGGWYKGLSMNWIKGPITVGISFTTHDTLVAFIRGLPIFNGE